MLLRIKNVANTPAIIELQQISMLYRTETVETKAVNAVSLSVGRGEYVSIQGSSGSGKSTLLLIIGLLEAATSGSYKVNGVDISQLDADELAEFRNEQFGFIFQSFNLIGDMSVADNVLLPLRYQKIPPDFEQMKEWVNSALARVNLLHRKDHFPAQLSGGQQQRVAIARAIICQPKIILADEPTGNLDSENADSVMDLLQELNNEGTAICLISHNPRFADYAAKRYRMLDGGLKQII